MILQLGKANCILQFRQKATQSSLQGHNNYIKRIKNVQFI